MAKRIVNQRRARAACWLGADLAPEVGPAAATLLALIVAGLLLASAPPPVQAQDKRLVVHPKSQVWIQGEATTHDFTCHNERVDGRAQLPPAQDSIPTSAQKTAETDVTVTVPVRAFECGNGEISSTLKEALEAKEHPKIHFEVKSATLKAPLDTLGHWYQVEVFGALTIAGTKRTLRFKSAGRALSEKKFRIKGCYPIRMTHFNIEPPSKAFGLIQVKNRVQVQFDLLAHTTSLPVSAPFASLTVEDSPTCSGT